MYTTDFLPNSGRPCAGLFFARAPVRRSPGPGGAQGHVSEAVGEAMQAHLRLSSGLVRVRIEGPDGAPALVLSHSLAAHLGMWDDQIPRWARRFRVVRYDLRGHGGSAG